jgi:hypothetical protein|tara:strand:+ start:67 stop:261 length:195 start_codon:yes stop_codon:yes gene_type:complete
MKIFITEFIYKGVTYEGPPIIARNFAKAEKEAKRYDVKVVGELDVVQEHENFGWQTSQWNRVLH